MLRLTSYSSYSKLAILSLALLTSSHAFSFDFKTGHDEALRNEEIVRKSARAFQLNMLAQQSLEKFAALHAVRFEGKSLMALSWKSDLSQKRSIYTDPVASMKASVKSINGSSCELILSIYDSAAPRICGSALSSSICMGLPYAEGHQLEVLNFRNRRVAFITGKCLESGPRGLEMRSLKGATSEAAEIVENILPQN